MKLSVLRHSLKKGVVHWLKGLFSGQHINQTLDWPGYMKRDIGITDDTLPSDRASRPVPLTATLGERMRW